MTKPIYKKMAFYEIGGGRFKNDIQEDFEKAQDLAVKRGVPITVKMEIKVFPPSQEEPEMSGVSWTRSINQPAYKSIPHLTVLRHGKIIANAADCPEQLKLDLNPQNISEFRKAAEEG